MASEEEVVLWRDGKGVAHEGGRVDYKCAGHLAGDTVRIPRLVFSGSEKKKFVSGNTSELNIQFRILLRVHHSRNGNSEVGDGSPEICLAPGIIVR